MAEQAGNILFDQIEQQMKRRNRARKTLNIVICLIIALLGITATIYKVRYEGGFITCFREMTVCATVLTTLTSIAMIPLNLFELKIGSEISSRVLFFFRLSSAVTEFIVLMITLIGFLHFFSDHPVIARYDNFASFAAATSSSGVRRPSEKLVWVCKSLAINQLSLPVPYSKQARIPAGELTETESSSAASAASEDEADENADEEVDEGLTEENADEEAYYEEGTDEEVYYEETDEGDGGYYEEETGEEEYYEEEA